MPPKGFHHSDTAKKKIREARLRQVMPSDVRQKISNTKKIGRIPNKVCIVCGTKYYVKPCRINKSRFCSKICEKKYGKKETRKRRVILTCEYCGKKYETYKCRETIHRTCCPEHGVLIRSGRPSPNRGVPLPKEQKIKQSCTKRGISLSDFNGFAKQQKYCDKWPSARERSRRWYKYINKYYCFLCGKIEEDNGWTGHKRQLSIHHVYYNKDACCNNESPWEFVPLCQGCNTRVNAPEKKDDYIRFFSDLIKKELNGKTYLRMWESKWLDTFGELPNYK